MIDLPFKIIFYKSYRRFGLPKLMPMCITLSVTNKCNSKCKICNIWKAYKKNPKKAKEELTLEEYKKIFANFKEFFWVTIDGGEPFLRKDLKDIVFSLYGATKPKFLTIATNAILTKKIVGDVRYIVKKCPKMKIFVNLSLDGIGNAHDNIRGAKGNFKKVLKTFKALKKIRAENLFVSINSVISKYNVNHIQKLYRFITENIKPDSHIFELAENRAKLYNLNIDLSIKEEYCMNVMKFIILKLKEEKKQGVSNLIRKLRIEYYNSLLTGKLPTNFEGIASAYLTPRGEVWLSYSKRYVAGNLRDSNYDFKKIWFSDKTKKFRERMKNNYKTTSVNAFYVNSLCNFLYLSKILFS